MPILAKTLTSMNIIRWAAILTTAIFLIAIFATLSIDHGGQTVGWCAGVVSGESQTLCPMGALEHLTWWDNAFAGIINR